MNDLSDDYTNESFPALSEDLKYTSGSYGYNNFEI